MRAPRVMCPADVMCLRVRGAEHITSLCSKAAKHHCERSEQHHLRPRSQISLKKPSEQPAPPLCGGFLPLNPKLFDNYAEI